MAPLPSLGTAEYDELVWGYFRAQRFAGDFADFGTEIQIDNYRTAGSDALPHPHVERQAVFVDQFDGDRPFSVEEYRPLLELD